MSFNIAGNFPTSNLPNATARANWVNLQASDTALKFLDGINIDYEDAIEPNTPEQKGLTSLVRETASVFHSVLPGSQVQHHEFLFESSFTKIQERTFIYFLNCLR